MLRKFAESWLALIFFYFVLKGNVSSYLVKKYGFPADCKITPFTGDNLQSLIGLAVKKGELIVSLVYYLNHVM